MLKGIETKSFVVVVVGTVRKTMKNKQVDVTKIKKKESSVVEI
jgi:hypothetical protein